MPETRDKVEIRDLQVRTIIGIHDWERKEKQDVLISVTMHTDTRKAAASDKIEDSLDYRAVTKSILALSEAAEFELVERLAEEIARICVKEFGAPRVDVTVDKPGAVRFARSVGVRITRETSDYKG
jgi:FolB domain-containing protein